MTMELRAAVQEHLPENELRLFVDNCLAHYDLVMNLKDEVAKNDVFHLVPMEVGGGHLSVADDHDLFTVGLAVEFGVAVAKGDQGKSDLGEVSAAEVRDVPAHRVAFDFDAFPAFARPVGR